MLNDIIKLNYEEDFTEDLECSYLGCNDGFFTKLESPITFNTKGLIGYTVLKNQLVFVDAHYEVKYSGLFKDTLVKERCKKFSHMEDLYIYYRLPDTEGLTSMSRFVTNKLILESTKTSTSGEIPTHQKIISHEDGGWCIVTYNSVTNKIIGCSERFDYK